MRRREVHALRRMAAALAAGAALCLAGGAQGSGVTIAKPTLPEARALWQGGGWTASIAHGGNWFSGYRTFADYVNPRFKASNPVPFKPAQAARQRHIRREIMAGHDIFDPNAECHPPGMPYLLAFDFDGGYYAVVGDEEIVFVYSDTFRRIYMDGRPHPDPKTTTPWYNGHSVGHWEGRTLVIDTANIRGADTETEPHTPKAEGSHIVERYTPISPGVMAATFVMTNPEFSRPWTVKFRLTRKDGATIWEDICTDGNRYARDPSGKLAMHSADGRPLEKAEP